MVFFSYFFFTNFSLLWIKWQRRVDSNLIRLPTSATTWTPQIIFTSRTKTQTSKNYIYIYILEVSFMLTNFEVLQNTHYKIQNSRCLTYLKVSGILYYLKIFPTLISSRVSLIATLLILSSLKYTQRFVDDICKAANFNIQEVLGQACLTSCPLCHKDTDFNEKSTQVDTWLTNLGRPIKTIQISL